MRTGGFGLGVSPAAVAGVLNFEGGVQWRFNPNWKFSGSLGMVWSPPRSALMPAEMSSVDREVGTNVFTGVVAPCVHRQIVLPWIFVCPGFEIGRLNGEVTIDGRSMNGEALRVAFQPRLGVELPMPTAPHLPRFAFTAFGNLVVPIVPVRIITLEGPLMSAGKLTLAWVTPGVAVALNLGFLAWFDFF